MNLSNVQLNNSFNLNQVIKVITGINNTNIHQVTKVATAAELAGASYLDIAANVKLVKSLKPHTCLPLCISSIDPIEIYNCVAAGADLVEIGNYDPFYKNNIYITSEQLVSLVKEVKILIGSYDICVTIPYHMNLHDQIKLARELEDLGVNFLQTEGSYSTYRLSYDNGLFSSLLSTYYISHNISIPLITSSSVNSVFSNLPLYYGASGLGIGTAVKDKECVYNMVTYLKNIKSSMAHNLNHDVKLFNMKYNYNDLTQLINY